MFQYPRMSHFCTNGIWFWKSTIDPQFTAQVCRIGDGGDNREICQWTVFKGHKELKKDSAPTLQQAKKTVFELLGEPE